MYGYAGSDLHGSMSQGSVTSQMSARTKRKKRRRVPKDNDNEMAPSSRRKKRNEVRPASEGDAVFNKQWVRREDNRMALIGRIRRASRADLILCWLAIALCVYEIEFLSVLPYKMPMQGYLQNPPSAETVGMMRPACRGALLRGGVISHDAYVEGQSKSEKNFSDPLSLDHYYMVDDKLVVSYSSEIDREWREMYGLQDASNQSVVNDLIWYLIVLITAAQVAIRFDITTSKILLDNFESVFQSDASLFDMFCILRDCLILCAHYNPWMNTSNNAPYVTQLKLLVLVKPLLAVPSRHRIDSLVARCEQKVKRKSCKTPGWILCESLLPSDLVNNVMNSSLLLNLALCWYIIFANEREYGICLNAAESACFVLKSLFGQADFNSGTYFTKLVQIFVLFNGFLFLAYLVDYVSQMRNVDLKTYKEVASQEHKMATKLQRESAAAVIQAAWKYHKSRAFQRWKFNCAMKNREHEAQLLNGKVHEDIQAVFLNKLFNWRKIRRDMGFLQAQLSEILAVDCDALTIDRITSKMNGAKLLSKQICQRMPYDDDDQVAWEKFELYCMDPSDTDKLPVAFKHYKDKAKTAMDVKSKLRAHARASQTSTQSMENLQRQLRKKKRSRRRIKRPAARMSLTLDGTCKVLYNPAREVNGDLLSHTASSRYNLAQTRRQRVDKVDTTSLMSQKSIRSAACRSATSLKSINSVKESNIEDNYCPEKAEQKWEKAKKEKNMMRPTTKEANKNYPGFQFQTHNNNEILAILKTMQGDTKKTQAAVGVLEQVNKKFIADMGQIKAQMQDFQAAMKEMRKNMGRPGPRGPNPALALPQQAFPDQILRSASTISRTSTISKTSKASASGRIRTYTD